MDGFKSDFFGIILLTNVIPISSIEREKRVRFGGWENVLNWGVG